jgi:hypothetical protein
LSLRLLGSPLLSCVQGDFFLRVSRKSAAESLGIVSINPNVHSSAGVADIDLLAVFTSRALRMMVEIERALELGGFLWARRRVVEFIAPRER